MKKVRMLMVVIYKYYTTLMAKPDARSVATAANPFVLIQLSPMG